MSEHKVKASARIRVTLEITPSGGDWGQDCKLDQIYRQALELAMADLSWLLRAAKEGFKVKSDTVGIERRCKAVLIGKPKVLAVVVEEPSDG